MREILLHSLKKYPNPERNVISVRNFSFVNSFHFHFEKHIKKYLHVFLAVILAKHNRKDNPQILNSKQHANFLAKTKSSNTHIASSTSICTETQNSNTSS